MDIILKGAAKKFLPLQNIINTTFFKKKIRNPNAACYFPPTILYISEPALKKAPVPYTSVLSGKA